MSKFHTNPIPNPNPNRDMSRANTSCVPAQKPSYASKNITIASETSL